MPSQHYERAREFYARLKPGPGRIAVREMSGSQVTESGLWLPEAREGSEGHMGEVVATCEPYTKDGVVMYPDYNVGDVVIFGRYTGTRVTVDRDSVVIMYDDDVLLELLPR